jgi:hydrogenase maturation protease
MQIECLLAGSANTAIEVQVRFLQLAPNDEAVERQVTAAARLEELTDSAARIPFHCDQLQGELSLSATIQRTGLFKLTLGIENLTPGLIDCDVNSALAQAMLSTHALLCIEGGEFLSLIDPPEDFQSLAAKCRNVGAWPVLVGTKPGAMLLAAPIILYDYPQIASESPGDLFDGTEIDEILSLRIQTLTDDEKRAMSAAGHVVGEMLQRTEGLTQEQHLQMHAELQKVRSLQDFRPGDHVRLRPKRSADALDLLLAGQMATVVAVERDFEDGVHLAVVIDDDPGRDLGVAGLPGHRFFFRPEEVEPL